MLDIKNWFIVFLIVSVVVATELYETESESNELDEGRSEVEARRRHHHHFGHHQHHLWIAGLHAIALLWAVKIKIFLVAVAVGFAIFYGFKIWAGAKLLTGPSYEQIPIIHETAYNAPYEHIIEHDHPHSGPEIYSNYPGPEPYSAYSGSVEAPSSNQASNYPGSDPYSANSGASLGATTFGGYSGASLGPTAYADNLTPTGISTVSDPSALSHDHDHIHRRNGNTKQKR